MNRQACHFWLQKASNSPSLSKDLLLRDSFRASQSQRLSAFESEPLLLRNQGASSQEAEDGHHIGSMHRMEGKFGIQELVGEVLRHLFSCQ